MTTSQLPISLTRDRDKTIATIAAAFLMDPVTRWIYTGADQYLKAMPRIIEAFGGRALDNGSAYASAQHEAVALWLGPGIEPDGEAMGAVMSETVSPEVMDDLLGFSEKQSGVHPHEPHWYLPLIAVDPVYQGRGFGSALLSHALAVVDQAALPAYLEATNLNNRRLYERHGFVAVNEIQYGSSPTMYGMWREAR